MLRLDTVAHVYNPSYLGGSDKEDHCLRPVQTVSETHLNKQAGYGGTCLQS
jgi:hypothetical protein